MQRDGSGLDFILSNMALASYAKLGGTPWHLKVDNPMAHELVLGLGSALLSESRLGAKQRVVGITTLFTNEGRYLLGNLSNTVPFEQYGEAVAEMCIQGIILGTQNERKLLTTSERQFDSKGINLGTGRFAWV